MTTTEFEIKVLDIDTRKITQKLTAQGFAPLPVQNFRRHVYRLAGNDNAWIRLRTNGVQTTLTYKEYQSDAIDGVQEIEVVVDDFAATHELLQKSGLVSATYQENRRTLFQKSNASIEISIDEWPHIPPYLEIEGASELEVSSYLELLELADQEKTSAPTSEVYARYGLALDKFPVLTFDSSND